MASAFGSSITGSNAASFRRCNASEMRPMPSRSTPSWISAFENGPSTQPIFVYHPQRKLLEVQYARRVDALEDKIVQRAVADVLNAIYEEDFLGFITDSGRGGERTTRSTPCRLPFTPGR